MKLTNTLMAGAVALAAMAAATQARELTLAYFMGPNHPMNGAVFTPFAEKLAEVSGGELTVAQFPGGALNSVPPKQYSILLDGVADIVFHLPGYTQPLFPITTSVTTPGMCFSAIECTEAMWRAYEPISKEFDAKILALWANEMPILFSKDAPIRVMEDMEGKVVRVTSAQDIPFVESLGASAVSQPVSVINQNLTNGVVDVISIGSSGALSFRLYEPANYITTNVPGAGSAFVMLLSNDVWNSLSDQEKAWVEEASGKWLSMQGAETYNKIGSKGIAVSADNGVDVYELPAEERARWDAAIQPALDEWLASEVGQGMTGQQVMDLMQGKGM
ncbi:MAG: TRAP transporter substrate-binding protein [Pseudomonadota bacterium]